jgi:uncharacterized protein (DUF2235 family)
MKNLVVCLDGTGNQLRARGNTNVVLLYQMLDLSDPDHQIAYYDAGLGTFSSAGAWTPAGKALSKLLGLAFGLGLRTNLAEAYAWLMKHWEPGDRIFVFGFSRGAYTARALTGMLRTVGLARPGLENLVQYAVQAHTKRIRDNDKEQYWGTVHNFAETFARPVDGQRTTIPIHYLGLWDTVKAAGVLGWTIRWPYTSRLPNVQVCRHAVSIDERRRPYRHHPVSQVSPNGTLEQVWFAGVHSDVGGTFVDPPTEVAREKLGGQPETREPPILSTIALKWVADAAIEMGLLIKPRKYQKNCAVSVRNAHATVHRMSWLWALATYQRRTIPEGSLVHSSVRDRRREEPKYAANLLPSEVQYVDADWASAQGDND